MINLTVQHGRVYRFDRLVQAWVYVELRGAGGGGSPPGPSKEENELTKANTDIARQQLDIAKQQLQYSNAITPMLLGQGGYELIEAPQIHTPAVGEEYIMQKVTRPGGTPAGWDPRSGVPIPPVTTIERVKNPNYKPAGMTYDTSGLKPGEFAVPLGGKTYITKQKQSVKDQEALNTELQKTSAERTLKALKGELPVDPSVEQDLARGETQLREELINRLGPGYETSDPGIRALNEFRRQANSIRYQVRYGELTGGAALAQNSQNMYQRQQAQLMGTLTGAQDPYRVTAGLLGQSSDTALNTMRQSQSERFGAFNLGMQSASANNQAIGAGVGGVVSAGLIGGAIIF